VNIHRCNWITVKSALVCCVITSAGARELEAPIYSFEAPITGVWGWSPQRGPGQSLWSRGQGAKLPPPPEAETPGFWTFNGSRKFAFFLKIWNAKIGQFVLSLQKWSSIGRNASQITVHYWKVIDLSILALVTTITVRMTTCLKNREMSWKRAPFSSGWGGSRMLRDLMLGVKKISSFKKYIHNIKWINMWKVCPKWTSLLLFITVDLGLQ